MDKRRNRRPTVIASLRHATLLVDGRRRFPCTDWDVGAGERWAVLGPSGSGKTLLAQALAGRVSLADGEARLADGATVSLVSAAEERALVALTSPYLQARYEASAELGAISVADVLGLPKVGRTPAETRRVLSRLGLLPLLQRRAAHLSHGERRKLLITRALLGEPSLLIVDDLVAGLDRRSRIEVARLLDRATALGVAVVLVASRPEEVRGLADLFLVVEKHRVVAKGVWRTVAPHVRSSRPAPRASGIVRKQRKPRRAELLCLDNVTVEGDGARILDRVRWTVRTGEHWALLGPNGSGKTTLLSLVLGDHPQAYAESVRVLGRRRGDGLSLWDWKRPIGHVSPELELHFRHDTTLVQVVASGLFDSIGLYREPSRPQLREVRAALKAVGLTRAGRTLVSALADGERRLALIARALVKRPRLLVLDELCRGLDPVQRARVLALLNRIALRGPTLICVTHDPAELPRCVNRFLLLEHGRARAVQTRPGSAPIVPSRSVR